MSRFWDDPGLVAPDDYVPTTVQALLAYLHLDDASRPEQESAIREWLKTHPPGSAMAFTLRRGGFGHLIERRSSA